MGTGGSPAELRDSSGAGDSERPRFRSGVAGGSAGSAASWCPPDRVVRLLPDLEALVYADPVCTQVRAWPCRRACPLLFLHLSFRCALTRFFLPPFLYACSFLHACSPPIIHGNLTSDTIFIQHNGLIKIGSGAGEAGRGRGQGWGTCGSPGQRLPSLLAPLTPSLSLCVGRCSVVPHLLQWCVGSLGCGGCGETGLLSITLFLSTS